MTFGPPVWTTDRRILRCVRKGAADVEDKPLAQPLRFELFVKVNRAPADVFALLADVQDGEPLPTTAGVRMAKIPRGPTTIGTRWHEEVRLLPAWWMVVESTVTEVDAPRSLGMDFRSGWFTGHLTYTIEAAPGGSVLHQHKVVHLRSGLRPFARLVDRGLRRRLVQRLCDIQDYLDCHRGPSSPHHR